MQRNEPWTASQPHLRCRGDCSVHTTSRKHTDEPSPCVGRDTLPWSRCQAAGNPICVLPGFRRRPAVDVVSRVQEPRLLVEAGGMAAWRNLALAFFSSGGQQKQRQTRRLGSEPAASSGLGDRVGELVRMSDYQGSL